LPAARRPSVLVLSGLCLALVAGCAGSPLGNSLEQSLEADPQLQDRPTFGSDRPETTPPPPTPAPAPRPTSSAPPALSEVPDDLRPYVRDWLTLDLVEPTEPTEGTSPSPDFAPNQAITRATFAQWLLSTNNEFYRDVPAQRIRPAAATATPAFQDVPRSHPQFAAIQGLAEAGLIPSAKTGNATAVTFRPDAPLTRETLVLWKVPLDTRAALPPATVEAVTATWGFQDVAAIEPLALRAVLADHQNGDFANIRRAFGYTTLFQPQTGVSQAEAAAALWRFGTQTDGISATELRRDPTARPGTDADDNDPS
jgi:hypothetical protein